MRKTIAVTIDEEVLKVLRQLIGKNMILSRVVEDAIKEYLKNHLGD